MLKKEIDFALRKMEVFDVIASVEFSNISMTGLIEEFFNFRNFIIQLFTIFSSKSAQRASVVKKHIHTLTSIL